MRTIRDLGYVKKRKKIARLAALGGFVLLSSTFLLAFRPALVLVAYALLFVGFMIFNYGMQQMGKWSRQPRDDQQIDSALETLSDKYIVVHFAKVGKSVVEHLLVHPGGILVMTSRDMPGKAIARGRRWKKKSTGSLRLFSFSGPQLGNPTVDTASAVSTVEGLLDANGLDLDVVGSIVFTNPLTLLDIEDPDYPVLNLSELNGFVRSLEPDLTFSVSERDTLLGLFGTSQTMELPAAKSTKRPVKVKRRAA